MTTWSDISEEIERAREIDDQSFDHVSLNYLKFINRYTKVYASSRTIPIDRPIDAL
jgi:hypothetical protein